MSLKYIPLTQEQINQLTLQGCDAEDWSLVEVSPIFDSSLVSHVSFRGKISIGDLIKEKCANKTQEVGIRYATLKNVIIGSHTYIHHVGLIEGYSIGDNVRIYRVNELIADKEEANLWKKTFAVGNEVGENNIRLSRHPNEQIDWICIHYPHVREKVWNSIDLNSKEYSTSCFCSLGNGTSITNSNVLYNISTGIDSCIQGAAELKNGHIAGQCYIGAQVIANYFTIGSESIVDGAANLYCTIIGNHCKIGKGFTAENCYFCHHCELYCGEACAVFAGPHTVSHHKSTLLIGGEFSFFNAGSGTNQSNHAYKMGPIHHGCLGKGSKTASGSHILWPMQTAPFSMIMGKIKNHPDLSSLPFSYVIAEENMTYIVPGINLCTIGTYRDIIKWKERGITSSFPDATINNMTATYDFLSPYVMQEVFAGLTILNELQEECGKKVDIYSYQGCIIRKSALEKGINYYKLAISLFASKIKQNLLINSEASEQHKTWIDVAGIPTPKDYLENALQEVATSTDKAAYEILESVIANFCNQYITYSQMWGKTQLEEHYSNNLYHNKVKIEIENALEQWKKHLMYDAYKEYNLGDVEQQTLYDFINKINSITNNIL